MSNYEFFEFIIRLIRGSPSSICPTSGIPIENPLAGKAGWENDMSIAPIDSANSQFGDPLILLFKRPRQGKLKTDCDIRHVWKQPIGVLLLEHSNNEFVKPVFELISYLG